MGALHHRTAELEDILDPWEDSTCSGPHLLPEHPADDFPGKTFRVLKEKGFRGGGRAERGENESSGAQFSTRTT